MNIWTSFTTVAVLSVSALGMHGCPPVRAAEPGGTPNTGPSTVAANGVPATTGSGPSTATAGTQAAPAGTQGPGQAAFEALKQLFGKWEAPLSGNKTIVDTFQPFAFGNAILAEE